MSTEIPYPQREQSILQDGFCQALQTSGQILLQHRPIYTDPFVLRQRWSITPTGSEYSEKAFYTAFDHSTFRNALRFLVANSWYTLDQLASLQLNLEQFTFLEEQEFLRKTSSWSLEERQALGFTVTDTRGMCWERGPASQNCTNIGHTLEWYVAEWFRNEYQALARHGVEVQKITPGGDLDVVALKGGKCFMVECKSTTKIEEKKVRYFLQRVGGFQPDMALLLIDTDNADVVEARAKQICLLLEQPYDARRKQLCGKTVYRWIPTHNIYVTNTGAGIGTTLASVLDFHQVLKQMLGYK